MYQKSALVGRRLWRTHRSGAAQLTDPVLAILAKAPVPGLAKTRLISVLGEDGAARLHEGLIRQAVRTACAAATGPLHLAPVTLWCTPDVTHPCFAAMPHMHGIALARQPDGDLGARMLAACAQHSDRLAPTLVIGSDCPALTPAHLQQAARSLHEGSDAVLIPAEDGGYVLIGLRTPDVRVFQCIDWGQDCVLAQTRTRLRELGWRWDELETLWDVDRPDDLPRLFDEFPVLVTDLAGLASPSVLRPVFSSDGMR